MRTLPLIAEIDYQNSAMLFKQFSAEPWAVFLDSADFHRQLEDTNRYSYIVYDPYKKIFIKDKRCLVTGEMVENPFQYLDSIISSAKLETVQGLPLFQGGMVGYFSYDLCHYLEEINFPLQKEDSVYADLAVGLYDVVIASDHVLQKTWVISTGFPESTESTQFMRAKSRMDACLERISQIEKSSKTSNSSELCLQCVDLKSPFARDEYSALVRKVQTYILNGDVFEVNLSHRLRGSLRISEQDKYQLYLRMRETNPSPFSAYLNFGDHQLLSSSPERFLLLNGGHVSTRPIKGTAKRDKCPEQDKKTAKALRVSEKDRSENIMIADLMRNDLSKVCFPDSVKVRKLCGLETYPSVHHLVTVVEGDLRDGLNAFDLLNACFPGGSITGAPKIRSMQIIYELEPTPRGPYCGSIGYVGFNGNMDTSIAIRTLLSHGETISYQAGGAVTLDSSPEGEYDETMAKSAAIQKIFMEGERVDNSNR